MNLETTGFSNPKQTHMLHFKSSLVLFTLLWVLTACDAGPGLLPDNASTTIDSASGSQVPHTTSLADSAADSTNPERPQADTTDAVSGRTVEPGMFYTAEELNVWDNRRLNGPFKAHWDTRIYPNAQLFLKGTKDASPWPGQTKQSCWGNAVDNHPDIDGPRGMWANSAGFVYRVLSFAGEKNTDQFLDKVQSYLLSHTEVSGLDFSDRKRWCISSLQKQGAVHFLAAWLRRLAITYSWIKNDLEKADQKRFENWLNRAGNYIVGHNEWHISKSFSNRYNDEYLCDGKYCPGQASDPEILYSGGPRHYQIHDTWNNRAAAVASAAGIIGIITNDADLRNKGKRFFEESLRYSVWPDGTYVDIIRTSPGATNAFSYPMLYLGSMCSLADALARSGDTSLYEYSTSAGMAGTESVAGQQEKSIRSVIKHLAGQVDGTIVKYGTNKDHIPDNIINTTNTGGYGDGTIADVFFAQSNIYYRNAYITSIYSRTAPGAPPRPQYTSSGFDQFTGDWGSYPDVIFMFGGLEGKVWPYPSDIQDRTNG